MTTIFELVEMMDGPLGRAKSKVPSAAWVRRHGGAVLDSAVLSDGVEITAYQSGFILYRDGKYVTVIDAYKCGDYICADAVAGKRVLSAEIFTGCEWTVWAELEGRDRIEHNMDCRDEYAGRVSQDGFAEGGPFVSDRGCGDPLNMLIEEETRLEEYETLYDTMKTELTKKQFDAITRSVWKGQTHEEVAEEMGITRNAVSANISRGVTSLREAYGTQGRKFGRNVFCRNNWEENELPKILEDAFQSERKERRPAKKHKKCETDVTWDCQNSGSSRKEMIS